MKKFVLLCFIFVLYSGLSITRKDIDCVTCSRVLYFKNGYILRVDSIYYNDADGVQMVETWDFGYNPPKKTAYRYSALKKIEYADSAINQLAKDLHK